MGVRVLGGGFIGSEDARVFGSYMGPQRQRRPPVMGAHRLVFFGGEELRSVGMADADRHEALRYNVNFFGLGGD